MYKVDKRKVKENISDNSNDINPTPLINVIFI